jgi:hypothetical protein
VGSGVAVGSSFGNGVGDGILVGSSAGGIVAVGSGVGEDGSSGMGVLEGTLVGSPAESVGADVPDGMGVAGLSVTAVAEGASVGKGVSVGFCVGEGISVGISVGGGVFVGMFGTKIVCPGMMIVDDPRQLAFCKSSTNTPKETERLANVSPGITS